jgi:hypothetical protein
MLLTALRQNVIMVPMSRKTLRSLRPRSIKILQDSKSGLKHSAHI